jgi:hypothetical protein
MTVRLRFGIEDPTDRHSGALLRRVTFRYRLMIDRYGGG